LSRLAAGAAVAAILVTAVVIPARAQEKAEEEAKSVAPDDAFYLGLRFLGSSLHVDETTEDVFFIEDDGGGFEFHAGYQFNKVFAIELSLGGAGYDTSDPNIDARFGFIELLALYRFAPSHPFRPYIKGGLGGCGLRLEYGDASATANGGLLVLGGGFDYFFTRHFSLGLDLTHNIVEYNEVEFRLGESAFSDEIDEEGAMTSLGLSFAYYF
jgi:opacity protein-like surface antigen